MQELGDKKSNILDNIRKRIIYFADTKGGGRTFFMKKTGIKKGMFDPKDIDRAVGSDKISNILDFYQNVNAEWLITGRGSMLKQEPARQVVNEMAVSNSELLDRIERLSTEKARLEYKLEMLEAEKKIKGSIIHGFDAESEHELKKKK